MFNNYVVNDVFKFMVVHEPALVHELSEFMTVHEQPMFGELMSRISSWTYEISWKFHLLFLNSHEPFMNSLMPVHERS